jgi:CubicO group peptidase (beta-lactamase class C family)
MRICLLPVFFIGIFLLPFGLAQTTASLDSIPARMHDVIVANDVAGAVTVVATRDSVLRMDAQGWADPEHKSFMRVDSIFWIASMSKPITATAVLMLMEGNAAPWRRIEISLQRQTSVPDLTADYV